MTDTEARRLAEEILRDDNAPYAGPDMTVTRQLWAASSAPTLARAYLDVLTRLETPGLTTDDLDLIEQARGRHPGGISRGLVRIIDRITQPTSTAGEQPDTAPVQNEDAKNYIKRTLRTASAHHAEVTDPSHGGTGVGSASLPSVGPELLDIGMEAYLAAVPEWLVRKNEGSVLAEPLKAAFLAMTAALLPPVTTAPAVDGGGK